MRRGLVPLLAAPAPALAHDLGAKYGAFVGPALHVFTEIDHVAAFLAVGLLAGQQAVRIRTTGLVAFGLALLCGIAAPLAFAAFDGLGSGERLLISASLVVTGVLVAVGRQLPVWLAGLASGALGLLHGLANGLEIAAGTRAVMSVSGAVVATAVIVAAGTLFAAILGGPRGRIVVRVLGSWVAALGLMLLGLALAPGNRHSGESRNPELRDRARCAALDPGFAGVTNPLSGRLLPRPLGATEDAVAAGGGRSRPQPIARIPFSSGGTGLA